MNVIFQTSKKGDGPMGRNAALTESAKKHRQTFLHLVFGLRDGATTKNIHGVTVLSPERFGIFDDCDGLVTKKSNFPLFITHQDCVPIVLFDEPKTVVSVLHAGWRGVAKGILKEGIRKIRKDFSESPLTVVFGPGIQVCHFEVQADVADVFWNMCEGAVREREGKMFVDLYAVLKHQALELGIPEDHILVSSDCTYHDSRYSSWRKDRIAENNMMTAVMLQE